MDSKRQSAVEYIASISGISKQKTEDLIDHLADLSETVPEGSDIQLPDVDNQEQMLRLLYAAIESANDMILITDAPERVGNEKIIYANEGVEKVTGYSKEELVGKNPKIFQGPDTETETIERLRKQLSEGNRFEGETFNYRKDGSRYRVRWSIAPVRDSFGRITHFISVQQDVTNEWKQKKKLERIIDERESVLKEIHHRVKNNLAVITGLLDLQSASTNSEETREILTESVNRIQSIATLHEKLYETGDFGNIVLSEYLTGLLQHLVETMDTEGMDITTNTDVADVTLSVHKAVPLGLILNELVTNAFKHAFGNREEGTLWVALEHNSGHYTLTVEDDGSGLPKDLELGQLESLGLKLIGTLSQQLEGEYSFENRNPGTIFILHFDS